jgi:8-oxo-dGTP pyrophosphatase MutT (NUDIX family)/phosphoglycolate phosphatase-like HAD superfamily hydrolase
MDSIQLPSRSYRLYCFDLDDTLLATFSHVTGQLYPRLCERLKLPCPPERKVREHWGEPLLQSLTALFPGVDDPTDLLGELRSLHREHPPPAAPGARRILNILRRHGRHIAIFTSSDPVMADAALRGALDLDPDDLAALCIFSEHGSQKEDPGVLGLILDQVERRVGTPIPTRDVLVIGDDPRDGELARNGGTSFIGLTSGVYDAQTFRDQGWASDCLSLYISHALSAPTDHGVAIIPDGRGKILLVQEGREGNPFFGSWSGPHGRCQPEDILEEETVVREAREECGVEVKPLRSLYTRKADTKVETVSFWLAPLREDSPLPRNACPREVTAVGWFPLQEVFSDSFSLYPGTRDFFRSFGWELKKEFG